MNTYNDFDIKNGILNIYTGTNEHVVIPEGVTHICDYAFAFKSEICTVEIPSSVKEIGVGAFNSCNKIKSITIPEGVEIIGDSAFRFCTELESISLPSTLTMIGKEIFSFCEKLKEITIPEKVAVIPQKAFYECFSLEKVKIFCGLTNISGLTFYKCHALKDIQLPDTIEEIGIQAFDYCTSLETITIPAKVTVIGADAFHSCTSLKSVHLSRGLKIVSSGAFKLCNELSDITIPDTVEDIGPSAFKNTSITEVELPYGITNVPEHAFSRCTKLKKMVLPEGIVSIGKEAFSECENLSEIKLPESLCEIGDMAFYSCGDINIITTSEKQAKLVREQGMTIRDNILIKYTGPGGVVTIPEGITKICQGAFSYCASLTGINIPDSVTEIETNAFSGCTGLADEHGLIIVRNILFGYGQNVVPDVIIPDTVTKIDKAAFIRCDKITSVYISDSVSSIGSNVFYLCSNLKSVRLPGNTSEILEHTFSGCTSLRDVFLHENTTSIDKYAFSGCNDITFHIPEALAAKKEALPQLMCSHKIESTSLGFAYLILYQNMVTWQKWRSKRISKNPAEEFAHMMSLIESNPFNKKTAKPVAEFILTYYEQLTGENIEKMISLYSDQKCAEIDDLAKNRAVMARISNEALSEDPRERLAADILYRVGAAPDAVSAVKKGIAWKDSEEICPKDVLISLISCYIKEWDRCAVEVRGEIMSMIMLKDGTKLQADPDADKLAETLDRTALSQMLTKLVKGQKYRPYILAWARFATDEDIADVTSNFKSMLRGKAKERYFAQNLEQALLLSEAVGAMQFYDSIEKLDIYASLRGMTAMEMRDIKMIPDFGFDSDGVKLYDIGGNIIEARLAKDLTIYLYDRAKNKEVRSIPKKGGDATLVEACSQDLSKLKKDIKTFFAQRSELICKMHISGEAVRGDLWKTVYLENPVISSLSEHVVWMDESGKTFTVVKKNTVDSDLQPYEVQGNIRVAHIMEMDAADVEKWQRTLTGMSCSQLFEQMWEPMIKWNASDIPNRYSGVKITSKERNALKASLKMRGVLCRSGEMEREYNYHNNSYEFYEDNSLFLGNSLKLDYEIKPDGMIEFKTATFLERKLDKKREMNAILLELDKACVISFINEDNVAKLSDELLGQFSAAQINIFVNHSVKADCVNCRARLMDYKNTRYPEYASVDEFVLEW